MEINWDIDLTEAEEGAPATEANGGAINIDWDISVEEESAETGAEIDWDISVEVSRSVLESLSPSLT